ncbi:MAG TPA: cytochrome P460 family protein, partial [Burkholderiales bacterium]|nr:cytochrome P460 family protein [Burkholderiales bacterium]
HRSTLRSFGLLSFALTLSAAAALFSAVLAASDPTDEDKAGTGVDAARFTESGELLLPANLDEWVFLGASLGMGYNSADFDPKSPGNFQVVLMEPAAYAHFKTHGRYANGSMFLLSFYPAQQRVSIDRAGFVQGELKNFEIHLLDRSRFAEGRAFYLFGKNDGKAAALPAGSRCVECHVRDGAFDGTFAQFYPAIRHAIPADLLNKAMEKGSQH